jgi:aminomethyltransferase
MTLSESSLPSSPPLKRTPLFEEHRALGARLVEFGGWEMPVQYTGIIEEHRAVRSASGLFDVSHMGEFIVTGSGALDYLESLVPNNVEKLVPGQALYSHLCQEDGGTIDDLLIYCVEPDHYMIVVNAGTMEKDWNWFYEHGKDRQDISLENISEETALISLQGPSAIHIFSQLTSTDLAQLRYYHFIDGPVAGIPCRISRTGYTGENGFELYHHPAQAPELWQKLLSVGKPHGLLPVGLGARDTLRLEAGMCLYGHELSEEITPLEADLGWAIKLNKGHDFIGHAALTRQKEQGLERIRVGLRLNERAVARAHASVYQGDNVVGSITSGTMSISLGYPIAMAFVPPTLATSGTELSVEVRNRHISATVVALPFYKRPITQ